MEQNDNYRMVSLMDTYVNRLIVVHTVAGTTYTGILKTTNSDHIVLSTWSSSAQRVDGSKILSFYCSDDKPEPETIKLISKFYEERRK